MNKTVLSWTGDVGFRDELQRSLAKLGVVISDTVTSKTSAIAVGRNPKEGKLADAQLCGVPQVGPQFLEEFLKAGSMPQVDRYLVSVQRMPSSSTTSSVAHRLRGSHAPSSGYGPESKLKASSSAPVTPAKSKKRRMETLPGEDETSQMDVDSGAMGYGRSATNARPSKRAARALVSPVAPRLAKRTLSTSSLTQSPAVAANTSAKKAMHDASHIRYASSEDPGAVVALEGLIGIGKSTLCNKLLQLYPDAVDVYREETNEKFLQLFYSDPKRYGFALQWGMLKSRIYQLRLAQHDTRHGRWPHRELLFWDRSMIGDYTFALWNHLLGGISQQEMEAYESEFGGSVRALDQVAFLRDVQLFVLMNDEPARCKTRVEVNRKNASEQGIPLAYYEGLDDIHFHMFIELMRTSNAKVLVQPWGEYDDAEACRQTYEDAIAGRLELAQIIDEPAGLKVSMQASDSILVYKDDSEIMQHYQLISSANTVAIEQLQAYTDIYVPRDVMLVDPVSKEVNLDHLKPYNIKFYDNAFKRIVLFHLGHHQNIHFYDSL